MARGPLIAIELGQHTLRAMRARLDGDGLHVEETIVADVPQDLVEDHEALGGWLGDQLRASDFDRAKSPRVLSRARVGFKRLSLPTDDAAELPDMVRLAMQRDLPFDAANAVIDFVPVETVDGSTDVIAVAVPDEAIAHIRTVARASGFGIGRIALRSMGTAAIINELDDANKLGATLAIDVRPTNVEFAVITDQGVRFSRAIDLPHGDSTDDAAENVVTETQRTWMSYRLSKRAIDVQQAVIVGDEAIAQACIERVKGILNRPVQRVDAHPLVDCNGARMHGLWPLAGVLLEAHVDLPMIDFANPRHAPDLEAQRRKRVLFGSAVAAVLVLAAWTFATRDLDSLQSRIDDLTEQRNAMAADYTRYTRDVLKRDHIE